MRRPLFPIFCVLIFFLFSSFSWAKMTRNTALVLRDGTRIRSVQFDPPLPQTTDDLPLYDTAVKLGDLQIAAIRFTREGERIFLPIEQIHTKVARLELHNKGLAPYTDGRIRVVMKKGESFEATHADLIRYVGHDVFTKEMGIVKYVAYEKSWQDAYLPITDVAEIHFLTPEPVVSPAKATVSVSADGATSEAIVAMLHKMAENKNMDQSLSFRIRFATNSSKLTASARNVLDRIGKAMGDPRLANLRFQVAGHTDGTGKAAYNLGLSRKRAASAKQYLAKTHGIAQTRLKAVGFGENRPVASNKTRSGKEQNRRVEISLLPM